MTANTPTSKPVVAYQNYNREPHSYSAIDEYNIQRNNYIQSYQPETKNKTLMGAGVGFLNFGLLGSIAGAIIGNNNKSEDLREVERKADQYASHHALRYAGKYGASQEELADLNYKAAKADVRLNETKWSNKTFLGAAIGAATGVGLALTGLAVGALVTNPVGAGISIGLLAAAAPAAAIGTVSGYYHHQKTDQKIRDRAEEAGVNARNSVLRNTPSQYKGQSGRTPRSQSVSNKKEPNSFRQKLETKEQQKAMTVTR